MKNKRHIILGVHVTDRVRHAGGVQQALTAFGGHIKTRLGLHEADEATCSPNGLILLEWAGSAAEAARLAARLRRIRGVEVKQMVFNHP